MIEPSRRKDINGKWYTTNIDTHLWRWNKSGTIIKYAFYEEDAHGVSALGDRLVAISNYQVPILDSTKVFVPGTNFPKPNLPSPTQPGWVTILKFTANVVGQIMQKNIEKSETIGELPISVNNERTEYSLAPGGFKFESQPK